MAFGAQRQFSFLAICIFCFVIIDQRQFGYAATEYNRYLAQIFQKYGTGGTMTFEGLEHLMYNLGLGQIEFEPAHTIAEHRPKGFDAAAAASDPKLTAYFKQENFKLFPEDDVRISLGMLERAVSGEMAAQQQQQQQQMQQQRKSESSIGQSKGILFEFKEMHDPKHRHPREYDATFDVPVPLSANVCLSPKSLLRLVVDHDDLHKRKLYKTGEELNAHNSDAEYNEFINHVQLTPVAFMKLCPALLAQIDQHVCMQSAPLTNGDDPKQQLWNAWIYASASIFILSACGLLGILLVPLMKSAIYQEILKFLVAVAVGTLAGDALMHLLPHALVSEHGGGGDAANDSHSHQAVLVCACAFFTCVFMYTLEHLLPLLKGQGARDAHGHGHSHNHSHGHVHKHTHAHHQPQATVAANAAAVPDAPPPLARGEIKELNIMLNEAKLDEKSPNRPLTPVAFMVIIGDGLHNLTDGLAIGAAFAADPVTGMATAFAVLCHELPHELGDFALLLQTGVALRRAVYLNIVSSVLSFLGMAVGLLIAGVHENMTQWIYAGTAGSFLYIALADLVPAMSETNVMGEVINGRRAIKGTFIQIVGMTIGGLIMLLIAVNEHNLEVLFK